jgi:hypothetical protein
MRAGATSLIGQVLGWWVVLSISLLTPLVCIVHCLTLSEATPFRIYDGGGLQFFLCDHPVPAAASPYPTHHDHLLPRPLAEAAVLATALTLGALSSRPLIRNLAAPILVSLVVAPPTPPPRAGIPLVRPRTPLV